MSAHVLVFYRFFFKGYGDHRDLHSFPTRRSSDLMKRAIFKRFSRKPKLLPWNIQGSGKSGIWGEVARRIVRHPAATLLTGVILFGGLAVAVFGYSPAGFGGNTAPPSGSDSAAGQALLTRHFPQA